MKCDIVFHPATTTMSRCCNMPFVKRRWQDITCSADGACGPAGQQTSKQHLDDFGKLSINFINRPSVDHGKLTPSSSFPMLFGHTPTGPHNSDGRHRRRPCRTLHWDMFLLLQVWRQSCARTQSMFYGEGF